MLLYKLRFASDFISANEAVRSSLFTPISEFICTANWPCFIEFSNNIENVFITPFALNFPHKKKKERN